MSSNVKNHKKVLFRLQKDSDDYPPDDWESLWALETERGLYSIDNIPFFVRGISFGDIVSVRKKEEELFFKEVVKFSDHSVLRAIVFDETRIEGLRNKMVKMGCEFEGSHIEGLTAFDVPPNVNFDKVVSFLQKGEDKGYWEYEEASIRHE